MNQEYGSVICGLCGAEFATMAEHDAHLCPVTGFTPADPEHYGTASIRASKEAFRRGESLTPEKEAELDARIEKATIVDEKLAEHRASIIRQQRENLERPE